MLPNCASALTVGTFLRLSAILAASTYLCVASGQAVGDADEERVQVEKRSVMSGQCSVASKSRSGDVISYHYCGRLTDGKEFDCSFNYGKPYVFKIGSGQVIRGMDMGLTGVCVGDALKVTLPSHLAYGTRGTKGIPPNSVLIFYVKVLQIDRNGEDIDGGANVYNHLATGVSAYGKKNWNKTVKSLERAADLYLHEEHTDQKCTLQCIDGSLLSHVWHLRLAPTSDCFQKCKASALGRSYTPHSTASQRSTLNSRQTYDYLQMAYNKNGDVAKAAAAALTYHSFNLNNSASEHNVNYYFSLDEVKELNISLLEDLPSYVPLFHAARQLYNDKQYSQAAAAFENVLVDYEQFMDKCFRLCYTVDQGSSTSAGDISYDIVLAYKQVLQCQLRCEDQGENVGGYRYQHFHSKIYDHLQFTYYKSDQLEKAAAAVATAAFLNPNFDEEALRFYQDLEGLAPETLKPRLEAVAMKKTSSAIEQLLDEISTLLPDYSLDDEGEVLDAETMAQRWKEGKSDPDVNLFSKTGSLEPVGPPVLSLLP